MAQRPSLHPLVRWALVLAIVWLVLGIIGSIFVGVVYFQARNDINNLPPVSKASDYKAKTDVAKNIRITDSQGTQTNLEYKIDGSFVNDSDTAATTVVLNFDLFDANGKGLGTAMATVGDVKPHSTNSFTARGFASDVATFKLADVMSM